MTPVPIRVLLIDDDQDDYTIIREMLADIRETKYNLEWLSTYETGLEAMKQRKHDVYLVDYRLGANTGLDLLDFAKTIDVQQPIIFLTGNGEHEVDLEAMKRGASDFLVKGHINTPLLERSIRYSLKQSRDLHDLQEKEAQIRMQDRLASVGLLASSVAHDIGTPLAVMKGRAELILEKPQDEIVSKKNAEIIIKQIDRIAMLIRSLLNLAREDKTGRPGTVNLNNAAADVFALMDHQFRQNNISLENLLGENIQVTAESGPLHQVLLNLIVNSVHAIGTAKKKGQDKSCFIRISTLDTGSQWAVCIEDNGCGISKENFKNLFRPFFTTKEIGVGTGLGLVTSHKIVESWGGSMQVESQEGVGTQFKIFLNKA